MPPKAGKCLHLHKSGKTCLCPTHVPAKNSAKCKKCHHHHKAAKRSALSHAPQPLETSEASAPVQSQDKKESVVQKIMAKYRKDFDDSVTDANSEPSGSPLGLAKCEANKGFRDKQVKKKSGSLRTAGQKSNASNTSNTVSKSFRVGFVLAIPYGFNPDGSWIDEQYPPGPDLDTFQKNGLMVKESPTSDLVIQIDWTEHDIDSWMRERFPSLFQWLDVRFGAPDSGVHWVLLRKHYNTLSVVMIGSETCSGKNLLEARGTPGRKYSAHHVIIAIKHCIPPAIYLDWEAALEDPYTSEYEVKQDKGKGKGKRCEIESDDNKDDGSDSSESESSTEKEEDDVKDEPTTPTQTTYLTQSKTSRKRARSPSPSVQEKENENTTTEGPSHRQKRSKVLESPLHLSSSPSFSPRSTATRFDYNAEAGIKHWWEKGYVSPFSADRRRRQAMTPIAAGSSVLPVTPIRFDHIDHHQSPEVMSSPKRGFAKAPELKCDPWKF
ncbi:hypothetical protein CPB84DRAFT_1853769 [Gymnopilus junonius]|uniref:Uncharacterized protein n=1 Tax=Gymnopilus junonius TaxID=109634 RepID=A0A9P5TFF3_GYMJU|nr:hypothetical protein CPB84DRAFT_1853769 [Gymnopilus junonius]